MAAEKEAEGTLFLNKGMRHFDLGPGADGKTRRHSPGATMLYSAAEAKAHAGYVDLIDIAKMPGQVNTKQLKADNANLLDENAKLKAQLAALQPKAEKSEPAVAKIDKKAKEVKEAVKA